MVHIDSIETLCSTIDNFKQNNIPFHIIGHDYEDYTGSYFSEKPPNNKWFIRLVVLSGIGELYYSQFIRLDDDEELKSTKDKLSTLPITFGEVTYLNGIIKIK